MQILQSAQLQELDEFSITRQQISSWDLMERAAQACVNWITTNPQTWLSSASNKNERKLAYVFCGHGNNGGDGLAVARLLTQRFFRVVVIEVIPPDKNRSADNQRNSLLLDTVKGAKKIAWDDFKDIPNFPIPDIAIDALLGVGFKPPLHSTYSDVIDYLNRLTCPKLSLDIASGLPNAFSHTLRPQAIVHTQITLSFHCPKLPFLLADYDAYVGQWHVLDIGLDVSENQAFKTNYHFFTNADALSLYRHPSKYEHKGHRGHVAIWAGSENKAGAALLTTRGALRAGAGLTTLISCHSTLQALNNTLPEAMCLPENNAHSYNTLEKFNCLVIGPGWGVTSERESQLKSLIQQSPAPLVLDADALTLLANNPTWLSFLPAGSILTPHPGEMDRFTGKSTSATERLEKAIAFACKHQLIVVLKGAHTVTIEPTGNCTFNSSGNPALAKGGSGDVLAGIIGALVAQGYPSIHAAQLGVYLHGLSADCWVQHHSAETMLAHEIADGLPVAFELFLSSHTKSLH